MTTVLVTLAVLAVAVAAVVGYVRLRHRRRSAGGEDEAAVRGARSERHRRAAERAQAQHDGWNRGGHGFTG
ncbi:hypothetical protein AB0H57_26080 [Micromonospora sp. NPDC050686]|uniref:hypothetical protein n=1 Tax=Micromonospora sp. NPDC050686 TaxID=3154631 RepID=UPI003408EE52